MWNENVTMSATDNKKELRKVETNQEGNVIQYLGG